MRAAARAWHYPPGLPVVEHRDEIIAAVRDHPVVVVVSETGSGKTTQLPKMVCEALEAGSGEGGARSMERGAGSVKGGRTPRALVGCTQPRRIAAASVARRVAEELGEPLGGFVGYQVRFEDRTSPETRIKFMTDGILLAETQGDPDLRRYGALILDEAHERSLNIDFLLGYLKRLLGRRPDLRVVISSATLDAGSFAGFFADRGAGRSRDGLERDAPATVPVVEAAGRTFPVEEVFLPPKVDEELPEQVVRAVGWLDDTGEDGDVLVFLPGEREIRDCAEALEGRRLRRTEVLPLFARLGMADQQRIFQPGAKRRIVLATNVAETSLTIPRIACVIDSGLARVSRWSPGRGVQRLQVEEVSRASARQRKGRCGRLREGVCLRLYEEENLAERPEFTDPEIRRSSLAGVILRMKSLGLPAIEAFPFLDPPAPKAVAEGYRTLREVGALDRDKGLTEIGRRMASLPVDPRLARILIEAEREGVVESVLPVVAGLETQDPRERPAEKTAEADQAHARWKDADSDFLGMWRLWCGLQEFRKGSGWHSNRLRKFCRTNFLNFRRVMEWANVAEELGGAFRQGGAGRSRDGLERDAPATVPDYAAFHRALLAGVPRQFGVWDREEKVYRSAQGGAFAVFPGSGLFGGKRPEWVMAMELVETTRLWARRVARIEPEWVESVAPHLCRSRYGEGHWDEGQGAVYAKETVLCGGLPVVAGRRVHFGRVDPAGARRIFIREGLAKGGVRGRSRIVERLEELREEVGLIERKLRRVGGLWSEEAVIDYYERRLPEGLSTAKAFHRWRRSHEDEPLPSRGEVVLEDLEGLELEGYPDWLAQRGQEYAVYYECEPGARDDGVTLGVHVDQLGELPEWLPGWGVDGTLERRAEWLIRSLPKDLRRACQPVAERAREFALAWCGREKDGAVEVRLAEYLRETVGYGIEAGDFDPSRLPEELVTKVWVCDDAGEELAFGTGVGELKRRLGAVMRERFEAAADDEWRREPEPAWEVGEVPEEAEAAGGTVFPALSVEEGGVGVRGFAVREEARESHREALVWLLREAHPDQAKYVGKRLPLELATRLELGRVGVDEDELLRVAGEGALGAGWIATPEEFARRAERARGEWWSAAEATCRALDEAVERLLRVREWIESRRGDKHHEEIVEDLGEELMWLWRPGFAWRGGFWRVRELPRLLRAVESRLQRLKGAPLVKDLEKMERVREFWEPWFREWTARPEDPRLWDYGWKLEEFRVASFAPDVAPREKVSAKVLRRGWEGGKLKG